MVGTSREREGGRYRKTRMEGRYKVVVEDRSRHEDEDTKQQYQEQAPQEGWEHTQPGSSADPKPASAAERADTPQVAQLPRLTPELDRNVGGILEVEVPEGVEVLFAKGPKSLHNSRDWVSRMQSRRNENCSAEGPGLVATTLRISHD